MAKLTKEQGIYLDAMEHALKVAKDHGIDELEREVRYRSSNPMPLNVSRVELISSARYMAKEELMYVATASATALTEYMKMPPSVTKEYLKNLNELVEVYRMDRVKYQHDQGVLNSNFAMNETCKSFLKEDDGNESN